VRNIAYRLPGSLLDIVLQLPEKDTTNDNMMMIIIIITTTTTTTCFIRFHSQ
jgi:hypothetical protein